MLDLTMALLWYIQRVFATTHNASEQAHDLTAKLADQLHALQVSNFYNSK